MTDPGDRYRSRKFIVAAFSLVVASVIAAFGAGSLAEDAQDIAIILAAWVITDAAILKLYNDANLAGGKP